MAINNPIRMSLLESNPKYTSDAVSLWVKSFRIIESDMKIANTIKA